MEFFYHDVDRNILIVSADGGLNLDTAEQFIDSLETIIDAGVRRVVVDCANLRYISSAGLGLLLRLHHRLASHGGNVMLANVRGGIASIVANTRLSDVFRIYGDVDEACRALTDTSDEV